MAIKMIHFLAAEKDLECSDHKPFITGKSDDGTEHTCSILYEDFPEEMPRKAREKVNETKDNKMKGMTELKECIKSGKELENSSHEQFIKVKWPSGSEDVYYPLFCDDLPKDIIKNALREANETEENRAKGIRSLKEFMRKKKLTCSDDEMLITVLRICKYNIKQSESKLEKLLKVRQMVISKLAECDIKDFESGMDELGVGVFPYRAADGRAILFGRTLDNFGDYDFDLVLTYLLAFLLYILCQVPASFLGVIYITDAGTPSMNVMYLLIKLYRHLLPNVISLPIKLGKIEAVNEHILARWFYYVVRPFMPRKIANRVSFHGKGYENLRKCYHPDILPNDFGGNLGPLTDTHFRKKFLDFMEKLKAENDDVNP